MYQESGATIDDADGLVDYARSIKGVEIGVLIEERKGALKASLRAKDPKFRGSNRTSLWRRVMPVRRGSMLKGLQSILLNRNFSQK